MDARSSAGSREMTTIHDVARADFEGDVTDARDDDDSASTGSRWHLFGTDCPKSEIVFLYQVFVLYTVIVVSIYNLTFGHTNSNLWTASLSSSLGYLLPNPSIQKNDGV